MYKNKEIIRIMLDERYNIQYASIDNKNATDYLEKLEVLCRLSDELPIQYNLKDYYVTIDNINIANDTYYSITATGEQNKCEQCSKVFIDRVTGLYNRNYWEKVIQDETPNLVAKNFTLIIIDVDNFKEINDIYGHTIGDIAIEIVGQGIKKCIRKDDVGLRYGGDEFTILLFNQDKKDAYKVIERIRKEISKSAVEHHLSIQISTGVAYYDSLKDMEEVLKMADKELYREKRVKKQTKIENDNLKKEIEDINDILNRIVIEANKKTTNKEVIEVSKKLDELIVKYTINLK